MRFRKAYDVDVFTIIRLYQKSTHSRSDDDLFLDYKKLEQAIAAESSIWLLTEVEGTVRAVISMLVDDEQRICKITRMLVDPEAPNPRMLLKHSLGYALEHLRFEVGSVDLVYTTTVSMTLDQQELTLEQGFKILGVFPNLMGEDNSQLNGLTAYFMNDTLTAKRQSSFPLHHTIEPFFRISQRQCGLADLPIADEAQVAATVQKYASEAAELPILEAVNAPAFVRRRFTEHKLRHSQLVNFYPFYLPNCLITDPRQETEIFVRLTEKMRFAAIIGEHLERPVHPVEMYAKVQQILRQHNVSYIEIINDAADVFGIDCILKAGFTPCAYFPAFKRQGETRRDYVVFGKSFEYLCRPNLDTHRPYIEFYKEYFAIEGKNYFPQFQD